MCARALQAPGAGSGRKKKLLIAVYLARDPKCAPCEKCDCVDGEAPFPRWQVKGEPIFPDGSGGFTSETRSCPRRMVNADSIYLWSLFLHYRAGHLLEAGGIADQPAAYLKAMQFIESALTESE